MIELINKERKEEVFIRLRGNRVVSKKRGVQPTRKLGSPRAQKAWKSYLKTLARSLVRLKKGCRYM